MKNKLQTEKNVKMCLRNNYHIKCTKVCKNSIIAGQITPLKMGQRKSLQVSQQRRYKDENVIFEKLL